VRRTDAISVTLAFARHESPLCNAPSNCRPATILDSHFLPFPDALERALGTSYQFERELGGGGMSRVFLAEERALGRRVVIKVLPDDVAANVSVERFRREIALAAQLTHPHIVPLLSAGEAEDRPYFTMPYVGGESLRARLTRERELPISDAVRILREIASALAFAHQRGVVHRDIKPDNVLLADDAAMVTDFGVAKAVSVAAIEGSQLTSIGVALGTPAYMSPEQATADPLTDHRADIYAWGVLAYEMLTGSTPFAGRSSHAMLAAHITESPELVSKRRSSVPIALASIVMSCLEKRPADRPQRASELVKALDSLTTPPSGTSPASPVAGVAASVVPDHRARSKSRVASVTTIVILLVGVGGWFGWRAMRGPALDANMVAVIPFENLTGDSQLEYVGRIASDWIMEGIAQTNAANVVASTAVAFAIGGEKEKSTDIVRRIASVTRAATVVTGTISRFGDSLRVQASVVDARNGKLISTVPPVAGPASDPLIVLSGVRERLLGAIVSGDAARGVTLRAIPPKYSAYNEYIKGLERFRRDQIGSRGFFRRAIALDSSFAAPYVWLAATFVNAGARDSAQALVLHIDAIRDRLSPTDRLMADYIHAMIDNDREAGLPITQELYARTADPFFSYLIGYNANAILRPDIAIPAFARSDSSSAATGWTGQIINAAEALHQSGDHAGELAQLERGRRLYPSYALVLNNMLRPLAALRKGERAIALADTILRSETDTVGTDRLNAVLTGITEFRAHGDTATANAMAKLALAWCASHRTANPTSERDVAEARVLLLSGLADSAMILLQRATRDTTNVTAAGYLGLLAARAGNRDRTRAIADSLGALKRPFLLGANTYWRAVILGELGEREQSVVLLRQSHREGQNLNTWHRAEPLASLRGYAPFEAMITPRK